MNLSYLSKLKYVVYIIIALIMLDVAVKVLISPIDKISMVYAIFMTSIFLFSVYCLILVKKIGKDMSHTCDVAQAAAAGNFNKRIVNITDKAEMANFYWSINRVLDKSDAYIRGSSTAMSAVSNNRYFKKVNPIGLDGDFLRGAEKINMAMGKMKSRIDDFSEITQRFENNVGNVVTELKGASLNLETTSQEMKNIASSTQESVHGLSDSTTRSSENIQIVFSATEELSLSIQEISSQVDMSDTKVNQTFGAIEETEKNMTELKISAKKIGDVLAMITDIAAQTNLLALNATIEASRAGEAGRGFAVVANEVKSLAGQTSKATTQISELVNNIQFATKNATTSFANVGTSVASINEIIQKIIQSVESQNLATDEISGSISKVSDSSNKVVTDMKSVSSDSETAQKSVSVLVGAATGISSQSKTLDNEVNGFLKEVRAII